ncbi:MAG: hypothetical protein R3B41_04120 [Candidatus Doudnabacteria bacterium]
MKYWKKKLFVLTGVMGLVVFVQMFFVQSSFAQQINSGLPQYGSSGVEKSITDYLCTPSEPPDGRDLERCVNKGYRFGVSFGAIALVFFMVYAGYLYITQGENGKKSAKDVLNKSFVGMSVLLGSYVLLYFINPTLVTFRPIQPPIFDAPDLPTCEEVGFDTNCVDDQGSVVQASGGSSQFGERIACTSGLVKAKQDLGLPTKNSDELICKEFGQKLLALKTSLSGLSWRITDTIGSGHLSSCHKSGNAYSGTCADIGLEPQDRSAANWSKVCVAVLAIGSLQPINEADSAASGCPKYGTYSTTTGAHIHVNYRN